MTSRSILISIVASLLLSFILLPMLGFGGVLVLGFLVLVGWLGIRELRRYNASSEASPFGARSEPEPEPNPTMPPDAHLTHDERVQFNEVIKNWNSEPRQ